MGFCYKSQNDGRAVIPARRSPTGRGLSLHEGQEPRWRWDLLSPHTRFLDGSKKPPRKWSPCGDGASGWEERSCLPELSQAACERLAFSLPPQWMWSPHPFLLAGSSCRSDFMLFGVKATEWEKKKYWNRVSPQIPTAGLSSVTVLGHLHQQAQASPPGSSQVPLPSAALPSS